MSSEVGSADSSFVLPGLSSPAEILVDRWGVPHIYADSLDDLFLVQGFNAARDRLWQMDFWRRRGLGLLSEVFGANYVERDAAARLFLYRGDMGAEWSAYGADTERVVTAFTNGVNAYVELTREHPSLLPLEFRALDYQPSVWCPEDVPRIRTQGLFYNVVQEVARARVLRDYGPDVEELRRRREPARAIVVPEGLELSSIPDDVLRVYQLALTPPPFDDRFAQTTLAGERPDGSNNWAIGDERSATGRPLLANDPHRALTVPALRYVVHLSAPGLDAVGAGEPVLPGIAIGHNGQIAFGITIFAIDQEDLYVYETDPDDPHSYRYQGGWEPMQIVSECIPVKSGDPVTVDLHYTRHGPVIHEDAGHHTAFSLRAAWLEPGTAPYLASISYMRARSWEEFLGAMSRWGAPPMNVLYADRDGNIGWKAAGLTPVRPNWDGVLPVPGDGRYEWSGFYAMDELPTALNPAAGWLATANEMNLPEDYPAERVLSFDWFAPYRRQRIDEVLSDKPAMSLRDALELQTDYVSIPARKIVDCLAGCESADPKVTEALSLLGGWDADLATDSPAAALFEVWYRRHLRPALLTRALAQIVPPHQLRTALSLVAPEEDLAGDARVDLSLLEDPSWLGPDADVALVGILLSTLRSAIDDLEELLGQDREQWGWGKLHVARFTHQLAGVLDEADARRVNVGPAPRGGSGDTVGNTFYADDFVQVAGSTWRVIIDVGSWDDSLAMNAPGQSGDPQSAHYADLFELWRRDEAFPLLYTRERVEAATEHRIVLSPGTGAGGQRPNQPGDAS
jgi:penicillin amidase